MSFVRKCERCGRIYEHYGDEDGMSNGVGLLWIPDKTKYPMKATFIEEEKDLCRDCLRDVTDYILYNPSVIGKED